ATSTPAEPEPSARAPARPPTPPVVGHGGRRSHPASFDRPTPAPALGVELASGARLGAAFCAGVVAALGVVRSRRRRGYRPQPPAPGRGVERPLAAPLRALLSAARETASTEDEQPDGAPPASGPVSSRAEARAEPGHIEAGTTGHGAIHLDLGAWATCAVVGPWAERVVRAWLGALITRAGPYGAEVVLTDVLAERLFPGLALPSLRPTANSAATLAVLEAEIVGRTRRLDDGEVDSAAAYRARFPEDPFGALVVATEEVSPELVARWRRAASAPHLGVTVLVVDPSSTQSLELNATTGAWVQTSEDGAVAHARPSSLAGQLAGAHLFGLDAEAARALLAPVADAHAEPDGGPGTGPALHGGLGTAEPPVPVAEPWPGPAHISGTRRAPLCVRLLGPMTVEAWGTTVATGLRASAYELLAWFCCRPEGATLDRVVDALWPDAEPGRGRERFWTAMGNLRSRVRHLAAEPTAATVEVIAKAGEHYRPEAEHLDVDLWRFEAALADAAHAQSPAAEIDALERTVALYGGDLCEGADYLWVEPVREDLHRRALDAAVRLAERLGEHGRAEAAATALLRATEIDPICETVARRLMAQQAELGRLDAVRHTWERLGSHLGALDLDPEPATARLYRSLIDPTTATRRRAAARTNGDRRPPRREARAAQPRPLSGK
ncbi:MAG: AfsR/SARP family transcriptional regulator, partial [Acidimicrobiales bacterium]